MLQVNYIMIYIIHKISVLYKITRVLKRLLRNITDFYFFKQIIFFATHNSEMFKAWKR